MPQGVKNRPPVCAFQDMRTVKSIRRFKIGRVTHPKDFLLTAAAGGGEELLVAVLAVDGPTFLHEAYISQRGVAVRTGKLLRVPRLSHGH